MLDDISPRLGKVVRDDLAVAVGRAFLRAEKAEWLGNISQPFEQNLSCLFHKSRVPFPPVRKIEEDVPEFDDSIAVQLPPHQGIDGDFHLPYMCSPAWCDLRVVFRSSMLWKQCVKRSPCALQISLTSLMSVPCSSVGIRQ